MTYRIEFSLSGLPKTLNSRVHWRVKHKENMRWKEMVSDATTGRRPKRPLEKARLTLTRMSSMEPDSDNLVSGFKPIVDGLVYCGILENDRPSNIGMPDYRWEPAKPGKGGVRVVVEGTLLNRTSERN